MRFLIAALAALLAVAPAAADMFPDASNAKLPEARINLGLGTDVYLSPATGDNTAALSAAVASAIAAGSCVRLNPGVFTVAAQSWASGACITGSGVDKTIIRRAAGAATGTFITLPGANYTLKSLTVDGNRAAQTTGSNNIGLSGSWYNVRFEDVRTTGAKTATGWGAGLAATGLGTDAAQGTATVFSRIRIDNNDHNGCTFAGGDLVTIADSTIADNGRNGCNINPTDGSIPTGVTATRWVITGSQFNHNGYLGGGTGFLVGSYTASAGILGNIPGPNPVGKNFTITGNSFTNNNGYGLAYQGSDGTISGNVMHANAVGVSPGQAGFLIAGVQSIATGNTSYGNGHYGIESGGCFNCKISDNNVYDNTTGINAGGTVNTVISGNRLRNNGTAINVGRYEYGGSAFTTPTTNVMVSENEIFFGAAGNIGIHSSEGSQISAIGNKCSVGTSGGSYYNCYRFDIDQQAQPQFVNRNNTIISSGGASQVVIAAASTLVIPDAGDTFAITGTTPIDNIHTYAMSTLGNAVSSMNVTPGAGANGSEIITMSGGGCTTTPTATALIANDGTLRGTRITNKGAGCTSAPTCAVSGGTITGATCTAFIGGDNFHGRYITLLFTGAGAILRDAGKQDLAAGDFITGPEGGTIALFGNSGRNRWAEISRGFGSATAQTWTPVLSFGGASTGITYTTQTGQWWRTGAMACVYFQIITTSKGTATGAATITGLPTDVAAGVTSGSVRFPYALTAGFVGLTADPIMSLQGLATITFRAGGGVGNTGSGLTDANFSNAHTIYGGGCYPTTS